MKDKKAYMREYMKNYRKSKPETLQAQLERQRRRNGQVPQIYRDRSEAEMRLIRMSDAITLLGGNCQLCGHSKNLNFHHVDPTTKSGNVSSFSNRINSDQFYAEVDKCCLVCQSCHKFIHIGKGSFGYSKLEIGWKITRK